MCIFPPNDIINFTIFSITIKMTGCDCCTIKVISVVVLVKIMLHYLQSVILTNCEICCIWRIVVQKISPKKINSKPKAITKKKKKKLAIAKAIDCDWWMKIFYPTFYVPLYISPITISYVLDCVRFFSILNLRFFYKERKKTRGELWLVGYKVEHKK